MAEQVLSIMEIILDESNAEPLSEDKVSRGLVPLPKDTGNQQWVCLKLAELMFRALIRVMLLY